MLKRPWLAMILLAVIGCLLHAVNASAQSISVSPTTGKGSVVPTVSYIVPAGATCTLSGGTLSGSVTASGSQTLAAVTAPTTNYAITCPGLGAATLTWTKPAQNTDGSALTDLTGYRAYWGTSASALTNSASIAGANTLTAPVNNLAPGTWFFAIASVSTSNGEGNKSNTASKIVTASSTSATATLTVGPLPLPPVLTVTDGLAKVLQQSPNRLAMVTVASVPADTRCDDSQSITYKDVLGNSHTVNVLLVDPSSFISPDNAADPTKGQWKGSVRSVILYGECKEAV